jgi:hypothetical protein
MREWFTNNKIFLDWGTTLSLGIMSILVSVNSCNLTKKQIENDELLNMPLIQVKSEQFTHEDNNDSEIIKITNVGKHATNYQTTKAVVLKCCYYPMNGEPNKIINLPIKNLLDISTSSNEYVGEIGSFITIRNNKYLHKLHFESIKIENGFLELHAKNYIRVSYKDFKGSKHEDVFLVSTGFTGTKVDIENEQKDLFKFQQEYNIDELTIEQIMDLIKTQGKEIEY